MVDSSKITLITLTIIIMIITFIILCLLIKRMSDDYLQSQQDYGSLRPQWQNSQIMENTQQPILELAPGINHPHALPDITGNPQFPPLTRLPSLDTLTTPPMFPITDPVTAYDYNKLTNPLEEPTTRVDRYLLGPIQYRRMFNFPVNGYPDNPRWLGLLISNDDSKDDTKDINKILKLFGRQRYPGSGQYEYYTMINVGLDQIKVHIHRKKELYDDDEVTVKELNRKYKVQLNKNDDSYYNPYF